MRARVVEGCVCVWPCVWPCVWLCVAGCVVGHHLVACASTRRRSQQSLVDSAQPAAKASPASDNDVDSRTRAPARGSGGVNRPASSAPVVQQVSRTEFHVPRNAVMTKTGAVVHGVATRRVRPASAMRTVRRHVCSCALVCIRECVCVAVFLLVWLCICVCVCGCGCVAVCVWCTPCASS